MKEQSSLGTRQIYGKPAYDQTQIGRVVSTANYDLYGRIDIMCLDHSQPLPVWVCGSLDRKPVEGDLVLIGFIQSRSDSPYVIGFVRNECYTSNFVIVEDSRILIQIPTDPTDVAGHLLDATKQSTRMSVEITAAGVQINGAYAARIGDTVSVNVPGVGTCTGTITSGAAKK